MGRRVVKCCACDRSAVYTATVTSADDVFVRDYCAEHMAELFVGLQKVSETYPAVVGAVHDMLEIDHCGPLSVSVTDETAFTGVRG